MLSPQTHWNISLLQNDKLPGRTSIRGNSAAHCKQHLPHFLDTTKVTPRKVSQILPLIMIVLCSVCFASPAFSAVTNDQQASPNSKETESSLEDNFCTDTKKKYEKALTNTKSDEVIQVVAQEMLIDAEVKFQQGRIKGAIEGLSKARRMLSLSKSHKPQNEARPEDMETLKALVHGRLGTACMSLGHFKYAKGEMEKAIEIALPLENVSMLGGLYNDLGNLLATEAMDFTDKTTFLQEQAVDDQMIEENSEIFDNRKKAEQAFAQSIDAYQNALINAKGATTKTPLSVRTHLNLAKTYLLNAQAYRNQANRLQDKIAYLRAQSVESQMMGGDNETIEAREKPVKTFTKALEDMKKQYANAYEHMTTAYNENRKLDDSIFKANAFISIGTINSTLLKQFPGSNEILVQNAEYAFQEAIRIAKAIPDKRNQSYAWGQWGYLLKETGQLERSLKFTEQAGLLAQEIKAPDIMFKWEWQEGQLNKSLGRLEAAEKSYSRAMDSLEELPRFTPVGLKGRKTSFRDERGQFFIELTDIYFQRASKDIQHGEKQEDGVDARLTNLMKARSTMEEFKKAEIQDFYQDDCVEAYGKSMKLVDKILQEPPPQMDPPIRAAVLYPIVLPDRLELLLSLPNQKLKRLESREEKISEERLKKEVIRFREAVQTRGEHAYKEPGSKLFQWLIGPTLPDLKNKDVNTLVIVPDGALRTIPLGALYNQEKERFLLQDFAIAIASGIHLPDPKPMQRDVLKVLSLGLPSKLDYVNEELKNLTHIFPPDRILTLKDAGFTAETVTEEMKKTPFTIVHIATHGRFEETIQDSTLDTGGKPVNMGKLREMVGLFKFRDAPLDLLTLSACETAVGSDQAALGLAGVALNAGAKSVVATLWPVDDKASAQFVSNFYEFLQNNPNISKADALKRAQNQMVNHEFSEYRHPYYWAPFVLFNNWL